MITRLFRFFVNLVVGGRPHFPEMAKLKALPWKKAPKASEMVEVGSEEYGLIEIPKKTSLTVNEAHFVREETKSFPDIQQQAIQLAADIAKEEGISLVDAFESLTGGGSNVPVTVVADANAKATQIKVASLVRDLPKGALINFEDEELEPATLLQPATTGDEVLEVDGLPADISSGSTVTAMFSSPIAQKNALKLMEFQRQSAEIAPLRNTVLATAMLRRVMGKDWSIEQTAEEVPIQVINDLAEFCSNEMNGWADVETEDGKPETLTDETLKND